MPLVEDDHMVKTLTSNGAEHPFDEWILPRGARCGKDLLVVPKRREGRLAVGETSCAFYLFIRAHRT